MRTSAEIRHELIHGRDCDMPVRTFRSTIDELIAAVRHEERLAVKESLMRSSDISFDEFVRVMRVAPLR